MRQRMGELLLLLPLCHTQAYLQWAPLRRQSDLRMILGTSKGPQIPRSIKSGVDELRLALQCALKDRQSRMIANLPRQTPLGVESPNVDKSGHVQERTDRELARLFAEMFKPIIEQTVVIFPSARAALKAKSIWGEDVVTTRSFDEVRIPSAKKAKKRKLGFGVDGSAGLIPPDTQVGDFPPRNTVRVKYLRQRCRSRQVVVIVAPMARELSAVRQMSDDMGQDTAIILLNVPNFDTVPGLAREDQAALQEGFETIFHLMPLRDSSVNTQDNVLLYRSYPGPWLIAQKGLGPPRTIARKDDAFTNEEMLTALQTAATENSKPWTEKLGSLFT